MDILLAEYASAMIPNLAEEGKAMLSTLEAGFQKSGHSVLTPKSCKGKASSFYTQIEKLAQICDAGLVIAPDNLLYDLTALIEQYTINLGCPPEAVKKAADKLTTSVTLSRGLLTVPEINPSEGPYVVKPRDGSGSERIQVVETFDPRDVDESTLVSKFIIGDHISVSLVIGKTVLPLSINKQHIVIDSTVRYIGNTTPYLVANANEVIDQASKATRLLGCKGYVGVDIVLQPDGVVNIVEVNPRPTTAIVSIDKVIGNVAALILAARLGQQLPAFLTPHGIHTFVKTNCSSNLP